MAKKTVTRNITGTAFAASAFRHAMVAPATKAPARSTNTSRAESRFEESKHPRHAKGTSEGGKFRSKGVTEGNVKSLDSSKLLQKYNLAKEEFTFHHRRPGISTANNLDQQRIMLAEIKRRGLTRYVW